MSRAQLPGSPRLSQLALPVAAALVLLAGCSHSTSTSTSGQRPAVAPSESTTVSLGGSAAQVSGPPTPTSSEGSTATSPVETPPTATPFATPTATSRTGTVLLVPGYGGSTDGLAIIAAALRKVGRHVRIVALPAQASQTFEQQAKTLEAAVRAEEKAAGHGPVDIVAHSNGGVLARYWARHYGGAGRARAIVTLGSPQHGTSLAELAFLTAPQMCTPACREVRPTSAFLKALNKQAATAGIAWVSAYTDGDNVVTPSTSAILRGAINIRLQTVCPDAVIDHSGLLGDALSIGLILDELQSAAPHAEGTNDCARLRSLGS